MSVEYVNAGASVAAAVAAVVGFGFTVHSINEASSQLRANNEYEIRRDLRDTVDEVDPLIEIDCVFGKSGCDQSEEQMTRRGFHILMNFFFSVYSQAKSKGVTEGFEQEIADDFCRWSQSDFGKKFWAQQVESGRFGPSRVKMREEWC